jgi:hypothetical protein
MMSENGYNVLIYQSNELYEFEKKGIGTFLRSQVEDFIHWEPSVYKKQLIKKIQAILPLLVLPMRLLVSILHPLYQP